MAFRHHARAMEIAFGLILVILTPLLITAYAIFNATWGILGVVLASMGTFMVINFYNVSKDVPRLLGLLLGPALVILGLWMMVRF